jgi:hypothetical protein
LVSTPGIARDRKRAAIEAQLAEFRSDRGPPLSPGERDAMPNHHH